MSKILLPIKPEYAYKILSGEKKFEYRKRIAKYKVDLIVIYATAPVSKIIGEVSVSGTLKDSPENLWKKTEPYSGIARKKYNKYFYGKKTAYAYCLDKVISYSKPKNISEYGIDYIPQTFAYLKECPYCGKIIIYKDGLPANAKSVEHIVPESLGNDGIIIPSGFICDQCNNYFATHIEKEFLNIESIKTLRSIHRVTSKKRKIPEMDALFAGEQTKIEFDAKTGNVFIGLSSETIQHIFNKGFPKLFITRGINIDELKNNYVVSRFLIKIFTETNLYYALQINPSDKQQFFWDSKLRELLNYVRRGDRNKKVYSYTVKQTKDPNPLINDDFVFSIEITHDESYALTGMIFKLYELEFNLSL